MMRVASIVAAVAVTLATARENSASPHPLYVWSSHEGPAQVNLTSAKLRPFGNDFAVWNFRRQLSVVDQECNVIYLLGQNRTFGHQNFGTYLIGVNFTTGYLVESVSVPFVPGGRFGGGMAIGLDESRSGPGACQKHIIASGFQLSNQSNLQILSIPVDPHPPVVAGSLRGSASASKPLHTVTSNTSELCSLGEAFAGANSGLSYAPGGYDTLNKKLVISATRAADSVGCWLAVDIASCSSTCIPQLQYLDGPTGSSSDDAQRDRKLLDTIAFYKPAGVFVGIGRYLFSNGSVGVVPGVVDAARGSMSVPLSTAPEFTTWDSSWEGTIAVDAPADRMYWLGYTNTAMGNELVFSSASDIVAAAARADANAGPKAGSVASQSLGKLCGTHTDDMVAVGCPYALAIGRDSYWSGHPHAVQQGA